MFGIAALIAGAWGVNLTGAIANQTANLTANVTNLTTHVANLTTTSVTSAA